MQQVEVAIGMIVREGKILITQRRRQDALGGFWEFPGGKREPGESLEQCLLREIAEELAIEIRIVNRFDTIDYDYRTGSVRLYPYLCECVAGEPRPLASQRLEWVAPADLSRYAFPPANDGLIKDLVRQLSVPISQAS